MLKVTFGTQEGCEIFIAYTMNNQLTMAILRTKNFKKKILFSNLETFNMQLFESSDVVAMQTIYSHYSQMLSVTE